MHVTEVTELLLGSTLVFRCALEGLIIVSQDGLLRFFSPPLFSASPHCNPSHPPQLMLPYIHLVTSASFHIFVVLCAGPAFEILDTTSAIVRTLVYY